MTRQAWSVAFAFLVACGGGGGGGPPPGGSTGVILAADSSWSCGIVSGGKLACFDANRTSPVLAVVPGVDDAVALTQQGVNATVLHADGTASRVNVSMTPPTITPIDTIAGAVEVRVNSSAEIFLLGDGSMVWSRFGPPYAPVAGYGQVAEFALPPVSGEELCAVHADGSVGCGDIQNNTVAPVAGLTDAVSLAKNAEVTCAVRKTGEVGCWGFSQQGLLGDGGATEMSATPVTVQGVSGAVQVALSPSNPVACALLGDGTVRCWGPNDVGQLGTGGQDAMIHTAEAVTDVSGGVAIAAGTGTGVVVLHGDGSMTAWNGPQKQHLALTP